MHEMMVELKVFDDGRIMECTRAHHFEGTYHLKKEFSHLRKPTSQMPALNYKTAKKIRKDIEEQFGETIFDTRAGYPYWRNSVPP